MDAPLSLLPLVQFLGLASQQTFFHTPLHFLPSCPRPAACQRWNIRFNRNESGQQTAAAAPSRHFVAARHNACLLT